MFIATTQSPTTEITKEKAIEDFVHLMGRSCEYIKELEKLNKVKSGTHIEIYDQIYAQIQRIINDYWSS
jgi:5'-3' exonuclease